MTARLILVCHASTDAVRRAAFPTDEPIDERGRAQALALADRLPRGERHCSSPELRARQTAEAMRLDAAPLALLRECNYGTWAGHGFDAVLADSPDTVAQWLSDPMATPHGGESVSSLLQRVVAWLSDEISLDCRSIVVTHATIIRAAIVHALETPPQSFWRVDIAPLSVTRLTGAGGRWNLASSGCVARL
jgi:broad specificity phosphatase PhoE